MTRFRGMISTHPGSTPLSSFKILALEEVDPCVSYGAGNDCGNNDVQILGTICPFFYLLISEWDKWRINLK